VLDRLPDPASPANFTAEQNLHDKIVFAQKFQRKNKLYDGELRTSLVGMALHLNMPE
jgi:hypothetical protein